MKLDFFFLTSINSQMVASLPPQSNHALKTLELPSHEDISLTYIIDCTLFVLLVLSVFCQCRPEGGLSYEIYSKYIAVTVPE